MATTYYRGIEEVAGEPGAWDISERWDDLEPLLDLRPDDRVLDVGCAEGLISMLVGERVREVRAVEINPRRVEAAQRLADIRGITNVSFEAGSIVNLDVDEKSFDIVLFLGVIHHIPLEDQIDSLVKCLRIARRQLIIRAPLQNRARLDLARAIIRVSEREGFETTCFATTGPRGGNLLFANRIGEDVRFDPSIRQVLPIDMNPVGTM